MKSIIILVLLFLRSLLSLSLFSSLKNHLCIILHISPPWHHQHLNKSDGSLVSDKSQVRSISLVKSEANDKQKQKRSDRKPNVLWLAGCKTHNKNLNKKLLEPGFKTWSWSDGPHPAHSARVCKTNVANFARITDNFADLARSRKFKRASVPRLWGPGALRGELLKLERYREAQHGSRARMTRINRGGLNANRKDRRCKGKNATKCKNKYNQLKKEKGGPKRKRPFKKIQKLLRL